MSAAEQGTTGAIAGWSATSDRARTIYFHFLVALTLLIALASFVRDPGSSLTNASLWLFAIGLLVSIVSIRAGLLATALMLTLSPSLHQQLNSLVGTGLRGWAYPGVDCCLGFIAAWSLKRSKSNHWAVLYAFPVGVLLILHLWIGISALISVGHNLWQSASEFSFRGLVSHAWLLRWITFQDDYFPLQDLFFYTVALVLAVSTCEVVLIERERVVRGLGGAILVGAFTNGLFAAWQHVTGRGWFANDLPSIEVNALWPDIHSFGPFMAFALFLSAGLLATRKLASHVRAAVIVAAVISAAGLYLSGSRSTLLIVCAFLLIGAMWGCFRLRGWWRFVPIAAAILLLVALDALFARGYRGFSYSTLEGALNSLDLKSLNAALGYRPEIWASAFRMYWEFPRFGLGQGSFYRLSSISEFSGSRTLVDLGGNGAHNYFLQSYVELGPVGAVLVLLIAIPASRLGRQNFRLISFYALIGIGVGNIYAHSLLVRETLMLAAIFGGVYLWEARTLVPDLWRPLSGAALRRASLVVGVLVLVAVAEAALSFNRYPFIHGQRCNEVRELAPDGWTQGTLRVEVPSGATSVDVTLLADRRDLSERSVNITLAIVNQQATPHVYRVESFDQDNQGPRDVSLAIGSSSTGPLWLEIRASRCYVPLNLGRGHDARHLGVRVQKIEFLPAAL